MEFKEIVTDSGPVERQDQVVGFEKDDLPESQQRFDDAFELLNRIRPISRADFDDDVLRHYGRSAGEES